jgi:predicted small metal-binding protein
LSTAGIVAKPIGYFAKGALMIKQIRCECGILVRARTDEEVVALVLDHLDTNHPALADTVTADDLRNWIELVPD